MQKHMHAVKDTTNILDFRVDFFWLASCLPISQRLSFVVGDTLNFCMPDVQLEFEL
jgi:hypothetical protein